MAVPAHARLKCVLSISAGDCTAVLLAPMAFTEIRHCTEERKGGQEEMGKRGEEGNTLGGGVGLIMYALCFHVQEALRKQREKEERKQREFDRRMQPHTKDDFDLLYHALESECCW